MAASSHALRQRTIFVSASGQQRYLLILLTWIAVLFALQQAGLGFLDYLPVAITRLLQMVLIGGTTAMAMLGAAHITSLPRFHARIVFLLVFMNVIYCALGLLFGGLKPLFYIESAVFAFALVPLLGDSRLWQGTLRAWFWIIAVLIALNTVPLMHWAKWVDLEPRYIPRLIDSGEDISDLDAYGFGIFGRTESYLAPGQFFGRLQGWALEPLHWGYFVALGIACALLLCGLTRRRGQRLTYWCVLPLFALHLRFVSSSSVLITFAMWILLVTMLWFTRRWAWGRRRETPLLFLSAIIGVGFIGPFALAYIPDIQLLLLADDSLGERDNWGDKIEFVTLGSELFVRFLPITRADLQTSHNLVLGMYIHYGYFLVAPLLAFFYWFVRQAISGLPMLLAAGGILILMTHLLLVPPLMFYPSGALFLGLQLVAADYYRRQIALNRDLAPPVQHDVKS